MILFHIGLIKTGTTYLQNNYFGRLNAKFAGKDLGIIKKLTNDQHTGDYNKFVNYIFKKKKLSLKKNKKYIFSREDMVGNIWKYKRKNENINQIRKLNNVKILLTIRSQKNIFLSIYKQYIFEGGKESFKNFFQISLKKKNQIFDYLNYLKTYEYLCKIFGKKNVLVIPFEMINSKDFEKLNNILTSFLNIKKKKIVYEKKRIRRGYDENEAFYVKLSNILTRRKFNDHNFRINKYFKIRNYFLFFGKLERLIFKRKFEEEKQIKEFIFNKYKSINKKLEKQTHINLKRFGYF